MGTRWDETLAAADPLAAAFAAYNRDANPGVMPDEHEAGDPKATAQAVTSPEPEEARPDAQAGDGNAPTAPEDDSVRVTGPRGETNDGEKVRDVVLGLTESQLKQLTDDVAVLQRIYGTRTFVATLLRAVHDNIVPKEDA